MLRSTTRLSIHSIFYKGIIALLIFFPVFSSAETSSSSQVLSAVSLSTGSVGGGGGGGGAPAASGSAAVSGSGSILPDLFTGSMSYSIPIPVPPGRNKMEPALAFVYRSNRSNGWMGVGWDIEIGSISRSIKNGVNYAGDEFVLEMSGAGIDLVMKDGTYHAKIESAFLRIRKLSGSQGDYWEVTDKSGMRYFFGQSNATKQHDPDNSSKVFKWCLDRVEDTNGNYMTFSYTKDQGQIYLQQIDYSYHTSGQVDALNRVIFHLEQRQDAPVMYTTNFPVKTAYRLKTVEVTGNGFPVRAYKLEYDTDAFEAGEQYSSSTSRSILTKIQQYGSDYSIVDGTIASGSKLPPASLTSTQSGKFTTQEWSTSPYLAIESKVSGGIELVKYTPSCGAVISNSTILTGDFNGDGRTDIAHSRTGCGKWYISLSNNDGSGFVTEEWTTGAYSALDNNYDGHEEILTGDFNGDGKTDIAHSRSQWGFWRVSIANNAGNGFITEEWSTSPYFAIDWLQDGYEKVVTGDFNGDGKTDIAHSRKGWSVWRVALSNDEGNGFIMQDWPTSPYLAIESKVSGGIEYVKTIPSCGSVISNSTILTGDFNGDGKTDIAHTRSGCSKWYVSLANTDSNGFVTEEWPTGPYYAVDNNYDGHEEVLTGDFNGDGKTDIAHSRSQWGMWRVSVSKGTNFVTEDWSTDPQWAIVNRPDGHERIIVGDFNGDGRTDIAHARTQWGTWRVAWSTGSNLVTEDWPTSPYWALDNGADGYESVISGDFTGDGKTDIAHSRKGWTAWRVSYDQTAQIPDLLKEIRNSIGGTTKVEYKPSTRYINTLMPFSLQTLYSIETDDGQDTSSKSVYEYAGGYLHIAEKDFRGFRNAKIRGPVGPNGERSVSETWFLQGNDLGVDFDNLGATAAVDILPQNIPNNPDIEIGYMKGRPYFTQVTDGLGRVYSKTLMSYTDDVDSLAPYFNPPKEVRSFVCDGDACTLEAKTRALYDQYGNTIREYLYGDLSVGTDDKTVERVYGYNINAWIVGLPKNETIYKGIGTTSPVSSATFYYDGAADCITPSTNQVPTKGNLARTVKWLSGGVNPEIRMAYDEYGNLKCTQDANGNASSAIEYDSTKTFPTIKNNAKGHEAVTSYYGVDNGSVESGLYGYVKSITDFSGIATMSEYDMFGRLTRIVDPDTINALTGKVSYYYESVGAVGQQRTVTHSLERSGGVIDISKTCPSGSSYNSSAGICEISKVCSVGSYDSAIGLCVASASCPVTTALNGSRDLCESGQLCTPFTLACKLLSAGVCPAGTSLNYYTWRCEGAPFCVSGTYSATRDACVLNASCPMGYQPVGDVCGVSPTCPSGTKLNIATDICEADQSYIWSESYIDGLGRVFMTRSEGPDGKVVVTKKEFNSTGTVKRSSLPYFEGSENPRWVNYLYDPMGRVASVVNTDNSTSSACYNDGTTIMMNADNHRKDEVRDVFGRLTTVHEYRGEYTSCQDAGQPYATTRYEYDVMGNLLKVTDAEDNETVMQYDTLGRKRYMKDPDMGEWAYTYYPNGDLFTQRDAKGNTITFHYDELNRLTKKDYPDGVDVIYTYDVAPDTSAETYPIGRLSTMTDESGMTKYFYDKLGRGTKVTRTVDTTDYETTTTYDTLGRITSIKYPDPAGTDGEVVQYLYDLGGNLSQVVGYATFSEYNALGQAKYITYGNNVITNYEYYPLNSRLNRIMTNNPAHPDVAQRQHLDLSYDYYAGGNVKYINDHRNPDRSQFFIYDELNRLKWAESVLYGQPLFYDYDQIGNITLKEGVNYKYADDLGLTGPVHAVRETSDGKTYLYDANGNMTNDTIRSITYNYDNMPRTVTMNNIATEFQYSGKGSRVKKITPAGTTIYIGKLYECRGGDCSKYIFAGGQRIALKASADDINYYHQDHLGSSRVVTNKSGVRQEEAIYYPFGATREDSGAVSLSHKYTSQELDAETGLYYYGARYYDPVLARFISPDTIVPSFSSPQSFNRYSYVYNNPLLYVDPDGNFGIFAVMAISATVNAANTYTHGGSFRDIMQSAAQGAVYGAIGYVSGGSVLGGMISGGMNAAMTGGNVGEGIASGAISGAMSSVVAGIQNPALQAFAQIGTSALMSGVQTKMAGGSFGDGFRSGAFTSTMTLALTMANSNGNNNENVDSGADHSLTVDHEKWLKPYEEYKAWLAQQNKTHMLAAGMTREEFLSWLETVGGATMPTKATGSVATLLQAVGDPNVSKVIMYKYIQRYNLEQTALGNDHNVIHDMSDPYTSFKTIYERQIMIQ